MYRKNEMLPVYIIQHTKVKIDPDEDTHDTRIHRTKDLINFTADPDIAAKLSPILSGQKISKTAACFKSTLKLF